MILADTSGLYAAISARQPRHGKARSAVENDPGPVVLSPFVLAELDYLVGKHEGVDASLALLDAVAADAFELAPFNASDVARAGSVIENYRDLSIGLADASLVVLAGRYRTSRLLTFDQRHFRVLRTPAGGPFTLLPADEA